MYPEYTELSTETQLTLLESARVAQLKAYAPYSNYRVGAALIVEGGEVFTGCNVENSSYRLCICAERVAIGKAISEGYQEFLAILIVTENGGTPCGMCRQVMLEFAPNMPVFIADIDRIVTVTTPSSLMP